MLSTIALVLGVIIGHYSTGKPDDSLFVVGVFAGLLTIVQDINLIMNAGK